MYEQIDGVAVRSPIGLALANMLDFFYETKLFNNANKPHMYHGYFEDTIVALIMKKRVMMFSFFSTPLIPL